MNYFYNEAPSIEDFSSPYFFFALDPDGTVVFASQSVTQVLGFAPSEMVGRQIGELLCPNEEWNRDVFPLLTGSFHENAATGQRAIRAVFDKRGQKRMLTVQSVCPSDGQGDVKGVHCLAQDVTRPFMAADRLRQRLRRLQELEAKLTRRERDVLEMMVQGKLNKTIARDLGVTERTVENVRARLKAKLEVQSIAEVASIATESRVLEEVLRELSPERLGQSFPEHPAEEHHAVMAGEFSADSL